MAVNLLHLTPKEAVDFLNSFDTIIFDCDGVLWKGGPLPGVEEALKKLTTRKKNFYFLSNNSAKSFKTYAEQFTQVGININPENLMHPGYAIVEYLKQINFSKQIYLIGTSMLLETLENAGYECVTSDNEYPEDLKWFLDNSKDDVSIGAVVVDCNLHFNYLKLMKALSILQRPDTLFLVGSIDVRIPQVPERLPFIGAGPFIDILSKFSDRSPIICGKPSEHLKEIIMKRFNITNPSKTLIIGDTLETDMHFGYICGFQKLLVQSKVTAVRDINSNQLVYTPEYVIETLGHMNVLIDSANEYCFGG